MKLIIAGGRNITDMEILYAALDEFGLESNGEPDFPGTIDHIVHGGAKGVDSLAQALAEEDDIECTVFHADWNTYGHSAGPRRNELMAQCGADALLAIWDGQSKGTKNMIECAIRHLVPTYIFPVEKQ